MLGIGRVVAQNMPHHIVQRGHNKNTVFVENDDYSYNLNTLVEWTQLLSVNEAFGRAADTLCQQTRTPYRIAVGGRYKMSIVESDSYFLRCCRYIELNPVKAKMVAQPEHYRWSSYQENAGLSPPQIINRTALRI